MLLAPGTRIGQYEIAALIGVGGMGEVYPATDMNLKRQVAIKVLPESLAAGAERVAQFERDRLRKRVVAGLARVTAQGKRLGRSKATVPAERAAGLATFQFKQRRQPSASRNPRCGAGGGPVRITLRTPSDLRPDFIGGGDPGFHRPTTRFRAAVVRLSGRFMAHRAACGVCHLLR